MAGGLLSEQQIGPYEPTMRERARGLLQDAFEKMGADRYRAIRYAETLLGGNASNLPKGLGLLDVTGISAPLDYADNPEYGPAMFVGALSKTWNKSAAQKAVEMEKAGKDARTIWKETGTLRGPDGLLRQEIDDSASVLGKRFPVKDTVPVKWASGETGMRTVGWPDAKDVINHPLMFGAYPDAAAIKTMPDSRLGTGAAYSTGKLFPEGRIDVGEAMNAGPLPQAKSNLLHELQHAIQQREGWARGGSPNELAATLDETQQISNALWRQKVAQGMAPSKAAQEALAEARQQTYRRLAGEAEARATQSRMNLTAEQRRALFPFDSYDVPVESLIVRK